MSEVFSCDDKEMLVAYLYGEIDADAHREVERHMRSCSACAQELEGLRAVRGDLESWQPPEAELGFAVVQKQAANVLRPTRWSSPGALPAWAKVAAAVLIMGIGVAVANVQVRYDAAGLMVTTGWMGGPAPAALPLQPRAVPAEDWRPALVALERELRTELAAVRPGDAAEPVAVRTTPSTSVDTAAVLRRVQTMLDESEQRQRQELALRLTQQRREIDMTRQADWIRIGRSFDNLQGRTFKTEAGQQEMMNLFRRVSAQPIP
jgi:hypothetical protein